jgi:TetR/AcrR family transcriptional regulator, cholesterol catabolism regulator
VRQRRGADQAQAEAVEVGSRLFAENGYSETTTRQLSSAMGITNGTFYHHFRSKEDLLRRICERALDEITAAVRRAVTAADDPLMGLEALITTHVEVITRSRHLHTTMLIELRALHGEHRRAVVVARDRYSGLVRDVIRRAQLARAVRDDLDAGTLTLLLLNLLNWTIFWYEPDGPLQPQALAEQMRALFFEGARADAQTDRQP